MQLEMISCQLTGRQLLKAAGGQCEHPRQYKPQEAQVRVQRSKVVLATCAHVNTSHEKERAREHEVAWYIH